MQWDGETPADWSPQPHNRSPQLTSHSFFRINMLSSEEIAQRLTDSARPKNCRSCKRKLFVAKFSSKRASKCNDCKFRQAIRLKYDPKCIACKMFFNARKRCDP